MAALTEAEVRYLVSRRDLIALERSAGRSQDLADVAALGASERRTMATDRGAREGPFGWTHADPARRRCEVGLETTPAQRLAWLEEMLDELLPLLGRARLSEGEDHSDAG